MNGVFEVNLEPNGVHRSFLSVLSKYKYVIGMLQQKEVLLKKISSLFTHHTNTCTGSYYKTMPSGNQ